LVEKVMIVKCANCLEYVEVADDAVGTRITCTLCGIDMMVPRPRAEEDLELDIAPVNEEEEKRAQAVLEEARRKTVAQIGTDISNILRSEKVLDRIKPSYVEPATDDVEGLVIDWLLYTHAGEPEQAASAVARMRGKEREAKAVLARLTLGILDGTSLVELAPAVFDEMKQKLRVKLDSAGLVAEGKFGEQRK
jgi:hypothetical protein